MPGGRRQTNVEFLNLLYELSGYNTISEFAEACGQAQSNMANYLNGKVIPRKRALLGCLHNLVATKSKPIEVCEIYKVPEKQVGIPELSGIYVLYDSAGNAVYIGKAKNFRNEVWQTLNRNVPTSVRLGPNIHKKDRPKIRQLASYYSLYRVDDSRLRTNMEALLLRAVTNQTHNINLGHFV
jgi:transcriptional regulator with XRE-family HTH domain